MATTTARETGRCVIVWMTALATTGCGPGVERAVSERLSVTLATVSAPYSALIAVAEENGYFAEAGVDVKIVLYPSGREALAAVMRDEAQVATVSDIAFAGAIDDDPSLRVVAAIGSSTGSELVARRDRNIAQPADLKGKRVAYSPGTTSAYHLNSFLLTNALTWRDITAVAVPPARQVEIIVSGEADAVSAFDVYAIVARKKLAENAIAWDTQNTVEYQWLLASREGSPAPAGATSRLLEALILAEHFVMLHPGEARSILTRRWKIDPGLVDSSWSTMRLFVTLNQSIITGLQRYAEWHLTQDAREGPPPATHSTVDVRPLEAVDARRVTIFR